MATIKHLFIILAIIQSIRGDNKLRLIKEWSELDFQFPNEATRSDAESRNFYIRGNSLPIDVDVFYDKDGRTKVFVTIPRFDIGRPFTLAMILSKPGSRGFGALMPYPDYSWHDNQGTNCNGMTSVFRIAIDECSRLWVLDTGKIGDTSVCPAQLLVFDLTTDTLLHRHVFSQETLKPQSLLITPVVDIRDPQNGCRDTFVYMADVSGFSLIVYDHSTDKSWRVENKLFYPYPPHGTFSIAGEQFDLMDGIFGMALSPLQENTDRTLYFHALASITENYVKTSVLRNASAWGSESTANPRDFKMFKGVRSSQASANAMDKEGVLFFGLTASTSIGCWNTATDYSPYNFDIVARDVNTLQFASGLKIINNLKGGQELWVLTCRFQKLMTGTMNLNEVNFRIQAAKVNDLKKGTRCANQNRIPLRTNLVEESGTNTGS